MTEILSEQYDSVFSKPKQSLMNFQMPKFDNNTLLTDIKITQSALIEAMKEIDSASTAGSDDLPAVFYNIFAEIRATPLLIIW